MGSVLQARCECGYVSREIFAGGGFDGGRNVPARCDHCREVITLDPTKQRLRCSRCGRKPAATYDVFANADELDETIRPATYESPRCHTPRLTFDFVGIWD